MRYRNNTPCHANEPLNVFQRKLAENLQHKKSHGKICISEQQSTNGFILSSIQNWPVQKHTQTRTQTLTITVYCMPVNVKLKLWSTTDQGNLCMTTTLHFKFATKEETVVSRLVLHFS